MKRRNADCGKLRRPIKRNKITEGMYGSTTVLYMKFLVLWAIVITADFMFMFRFEFLWPFWLLLRSVHDSFKYKGLAFSVLFVCIAITSDLVCLFFIPVHWLLFAASTYVWVQYVWHTDKGICLPTIILWMLFVYLEAGIRWKDTRHTPHLDLCRPFAAHCIGYPVVTLGFGFKSYVGYRMRQRKQREVSKENEFYMQLLHQALPQEETLDEAQMTAAAVTTVVPTTTISSPLVTTTMQSAQISTSSPNGSAISALTSNAINTMSNGVLATQAQNSHQHHPHHQQHNQTPSEHQTHQGSSSSSSSNHISVCGNNMNNLNNNSNSLPAAASIITGGASSTNIDDKNYVQIGNGTGGGGNSAFSSTTTTPPSAFKSLKLVISNHISTNKLKSYDLTEFTFSDKVTSNGHIGVHCKSNRRSLDKESKNRIACGSAASETESKHNKSNNYHQLHAGDNGNSNSKEKSDWESSNYQLHQTQSSQGGKDKNDDHRSNTNAGSSKKFNATNYSGMTPAANGNVLQYDMDDIVVEPVERSKGRRNRAKKDNSSKDNHHQHHNNNNNSQSNINNNTNNNSSCNSNHVHNHHQQVSKDAATLSSHNHTNGSNHINNSDTSSVSSSSSSSSTTSTSASSASVKPSASSTLSNLASKVVSKICESCLKLEADVKKYRTELSHMKQIENELRQKLESNLTTKSCLQAKQRECDELEKRIHELTNARHADMLQLQGVERRLTEERRQKQSLESQLSNEKKARKLAEEKAARPECSSQCKQRKQQLEEEFKQLRRDLKMAEDAKLIAEQHGRKWEQELRLFEAEIRNRDSTQPGTEMLMSALAAMQDKNCTLEKNLSAETRVKLDLFSALGDAKRQLEISESRRRSKDDEILDLRAKIAQLLAVMPTDSLCLPACSSTGASSMLRMNDTPPLQAVTGPASPMLSSLSTQVASVPSGHSLNVTRVVPTSAADYVQQAANDYVVSQQQQCVGVVPVSVAQSVLVSGPSAGGASGSNLDPNATVYTPKGGGPPGGVVVVGGAGDA